MMNERHLVSRFGLAVALLAVSAALPACAADSGEVDEDIDEVEGAIGVAGDNNLPPWAVESDPLKRGVTNAHGLTSATNPDPLQLCAAGTVTATGCTMRNEWKAWLEADSTNRVEMMKGIAKCAVEQGFTISKPGGPEQFGGQWGLYTSWKTNRLNGQDKRERMSSCILSLLNGNNLELSLCIIGPGGAPFSDACSSSLFSVREGGFFGDLFAATPTAYVAGPDTAEPPTNGRACFGASGNYCCAESDTSCTHRIVLAGSILGSPDQNFANKRCNADLVASRDNSYCPSFYSTREPGRSYTNVFTTFIPPAE